MSWGISDTAPEIEKIKAESADYLNGLNCTGDIDYGTYSSAFDFYAELLEKAYKLGKEEAVSERPEADWTSETSLKPFGEETVQCTRCGFYTVSENGYNFCPKCGAVIRGAVCESTPEEKENETQRP